MHLLIAGVANTGFLASNVTEQANATKAVLPVNVEICAEKSAAVAQPWLESADGSSALRVTVGQLSGRLATRVEWSGSDGTPDRALCGWVVKEPQHIHCQLLKANRLNRYHLYCDHTACRLNQGERSSLSIAIVCGKLCDEN